MVLLGLIGILLTIGVPVAFIWMLIVVIRDRKRLDEIESRLALLDARFEDVKRAAEGKMGPHVHDAGAAGGEALAAEPLGPAAIPAPGGEEPAIVADGGADVPEVAAPEAEVPFAALTAATEEEPRPGPEAGPEGPVVLRKERFTALAEWIAGNWTYVLAAVSLAFAGVFLVRYGIEKGYLTPVMRVLGAIGLGVALILAGERIRRRNGAAAGLVPATFSGAGFVSIFAGVLAARLLYGLIGPGTALAGLAATGLAAVVIGWFHGPFLAAVGLIGTTVAPFIVAGEGAEATWLYAYFPLVALIGLGIDTMRRWAWISVLALALGYGGLVTLHAAMGDAIPGGGALALMALLAATIPARRLWPTTGGPSLLTALTVDGAGWPVFPARLAAGAMLASSAGLFLLSPANTDELVLILAIPVALVLVLGLWGGRAPGLSGLWLLPTLAFLGLLFIFGTSAFVGDLHWTIANPPAEITAQAVVWPIVPPALAAILTLGLAARSLRVVEEKLAWTLGAVLALPVALVVMHVMWGAALLFGEGRWATGVMAAAAVMTAYAGALARADAGDLRRAALATAMALGLIGFAMTILLSDAALTIGFAVLVVAAAALDRRFGMVTLARFAGAGVLVLAWRVAGPLAILDALEARLADILLGYGGAAAGCLAAWALLPRGGRTRLVVAMMLEAGGLVFAALLVNLVQNNLMVARGLDPVVFWSLSLLAVPWLLLGLWQAELLGRGMAPKVGRLILAVVAGAAAVVWFAASAGPFNPIAAGPPVAGPLLFDTLAVAYLLPAVVMLAARWRLRSLDQGVRTALLVAAVVSLGLWVGFEIRRFWRGSALDVPGVTQAELYTYTVAMMLVGAGLLYQAIASGSAGLRRGAMGVIALTAAKVFLVDATGLTGLMRVFSFLGLGLALAGLAWLNAWAAARQRGPGGGAGGGSGDGPTPSSGDGPAA